VSLKLDGDGGDLACRPWADALRTQLIELARVGEDAQVEFGGLFGVVIEPEEGCEFAHGWEW
jgi:hypothetical protein